MEESRRLHVPAVDGLRAVAALAVVVSHVWIAAGTPRTANPLAPLVFAGGLGVDAFFVISGFLLFLPYARGTAQPILSYARRRAARLLPAYYLSLVVVLVLWNQLRPSSTHPLATALGWFDVTSHVAVLHWVVLPPFQRPVGLGINLPWWSLTVEVCFYVALPLIALRFASRPRRWVLGLVVISIVFRVLTQGFADPMLDGRLGALAVVLGEGIVGFGGHFAIGMFVAWLVARPDPTADSRWIQGIFWTGIVGLFAVSWTVGRAVMTSTENGELDPMLMPLARPGFAIAFGLVLYGIVRLQHFDALLGRGALRWIGDRSYGVYLFHQIGISALAAHTSLFNPAGTMRAFVVSTAIVVPLSIGVGAASYSLVERPAIEWARRLERAKEPAHN